MGKRLAFTCAFAVLATIFLLAINADATMKAGVASAVITPDEPIRLSGYAARTEPSEGVLHDIYARALALEDAEGNRAVMLALDIIGVMAGMSNQIAETVERETGLPRSALMVTVSHTHYAPALMRILEGFDVMPEEDAARAKAYTDFVEETAARVAIEALQALAPARIERGNGSAGFAINRREYTLNGIIIGENPIGPVDHDVPVMRITDPDGDIIAIVFGYACHNTTQHSNQRMINGDFSGFTQIELEKAFPGVTTLFFTGCGADANPSPRGTAEHAEQHGIELAHAVIAALENELTPVEGPIRTAFANVDIELTPPPSEEEVEAKRNAASIWERALGTRLAAILDREGEIPTKYPYPIQTWGFGDDFLWIALAGEVVVDYSLMMKHWFGPERVWTTAYANDVPAYIPSLRVLREGGYEADSSMLYYGFHGPWAETVEQIIHQGIRQLAEQVEIQPIR